jgi:methyltransferase-like protein
MLESVASNRVETEQYMDFLRNRMFRQTLLCHRDVPLERTPLPQSVLGLHVASSAKPETDQVAIQSTEKVTFRGPSSVLSTSEPLVKAAMLHLAAAWPRPVPFAALFAAARSKLHPEPVVVDTSHVTHDTHRLAEPLLRCYATSIVSLSVQGASFTLEVTQRPTASRLARWQSQSSNTVTNLNHESVRLNDLDRHVLPILDGDHDREAIVAALTDCVSSGALVIHDRGMSVDDPVRISDILADQLDACLKRLAHAALIQE